MFKSVSRVLTIFPFFLKNLNNWWFFYEGIWNVVSNNINNSIAIAIDVFSPFLQLWSPRKCHTENCKLSLIFFLSHTLIIMNALWLINYQNVYKFTKKFYVLFWFIFSIGSKFKVHAVLSKRITKTQTTTAQII